ncbi:hypothetical protein, partial [Pseudonocardia oceani]|uniref:hypothetical protein n=3 Tax=Pseudonocardia oceani TaxID=2792013 RepID=UPI001C4A6C3F
SAPRPPAWVTGLAGLAAVVLAVLVPGGNGELAGRGRRTRRTGVVGTVVVVDDAGAVAVVAQDRRLDEPVTVEGGLVDEQDGVLRRVELPG